MSMNTIDDLVNKYLLPTLDKTGDPILYHALRVALAVENDHYSEAHSQVALLHDIFEDTDCSVWELRKAGLSNEVIEAIEVLTHHPNERYIDYILRVVENDLAAIVKLYDIADNMREDRLAITKRPHKYFQALAILGSYGYSLNKE